ncbi:MAG: protein-disulfide reductase DsbD family protein [Micropepsaceae bacterium]
MFRSSLLIAALLALAAPATAESVVKTDNVEARLVAETPNAVPGATISVALRLDIREHWHTYWSYAGDSGEATTVDWTLPEGVTAGPLQFPYPHRIEVPPLVNFGYEGTVLHLTDLHIPASAKPGDIIALKADAVWLVCAEVCIPEEGVLTLDLPVAAEAGSADTATAAEFAAARAALPTPSPWPATVSVDGKTLTLRLDAPELSRAGLSKAVLFPASGGYIRNAAPQTVETSGGSLTIATETGRRFSTPEKAAEVKSVPAVIVATGSDGVTHAFTLEAPVTTGATAATPGGEGALSVPVAILFAFLGGLILNLMPCVFPVLSMKALALAKKGGDTRAARIGGLAYTAGVVASFLAIAGLLIALRAGGEQVAWGFQLQSPIVVAGLALLFFVIGLNLMGVFEVGGRIQNIGSGLGKGDGATASFLTGVLAAVVAAPCTAPFMAGAVGAAISQPPVVALAIFGALGLGMAAPYLALAYSPALIRLMPKPGTWMVRLKQVLAFPMFGSAAWLLWVLVIQAGPNVLVLVLAAFIVAAFGLWLWGLAQRGEAGLKTKILAGLTAIPVIAAVAMAQPAPSSGLTHEAYSPARLEELLKEGRPVFVNLTAAWCVTCLVNEEVALSGQGLADAFAQGGITYLKGDWTNRDPDITRLLEQHGRAGVPLYLFYPAGKTEPVVLPQLLTEGIVIDALKGT